jgi:hypothetical protein
VGIWARFRGSRPGKATTDSGRFPLVPGLVMQATAHELSITGGTLACWTFQSEGLRAHGQKELVLTIARREGEGFESVAAEVAKLLVTISRVAAEGRLVSIGGFTEFGDPLPRFASGGGPRGVGYLRAQDLPGISAPDDALAVIPLVAGEVDAAKAFGLTRIAARLGRHYAFYPWPPWWDRDRPVLGVRDGDDSSVLGKVPHATIAGVFASVEGQAGKFGSHLSIRILHSSNEIVARALATVPPGASFALVTEPDPGADALMVWERSSTWPSAITPPGSAGRRLSTCFVMVVPEQSDDSMRAFEDGASLLLRNTSWERVREALTTGQPLTLSMSEGTSVSVERVPAVYAGRSKA